MSIAKRIKKIKDKLSHDIKLVAVSKNRTLDEILDAYKNGQVIFGENKVQELVNKYKKLPKDIEWHMIGHLQTNKVKEIAPFISLIHSVDSEKLIKEINKRAGQNNRKINCLLQVHIAEEKNKYGFNISQVEEIVSKINTYQNIQVIGLMGMATYTDDKQKINMEFDKLKKLYEKFKNNHFNTLSMGMSNDYLLAIKNQSNMIRVGSAIFGQRNN